MNKKLVVVACLGFGLAPAASHAVPTVYSYTGNFYTEIEDHSSVPGAYTTEMRLTGSLTLDDAVAPNSHISFGWESVHVLAASFNDGRFEYTKANVVPFSIIDLSADATGALNSWDVIMSRLDPAPGILTVFSLTSTGSPDCGAASGCDLTGPGSAVAQELNRSLVLGTWTVTPVPEPSAYALMLAGVALVGFAAHRRHKLPH